MKLARISILFSAGVMLLAAASCEKGPDGYEVDKDSVVLEAYGPNPVLRGSDLKFVGQNLDRITSVILPVDIQIPSSEFKDAGAGSFSVTVPMECEPGEVTLVYDGGTVTAKTTLSYTEQFSISSVKAQDSDKTLLSAGDSVVVDGEYLNNIVKFVFVNGGATAEGELIGTQTRHQVCFAVPAGAMSGRIYGEDGNGNQVYSENELRIRQPEVTGVAPADVRPGDKVTVTGSLLDQIVTLKFSGSSAVIDVEAFENATASSFTVTVPADVHDGPLTLVSAAEQEIVTETGLTVAVPDNIVLSKDNVYKAGNSIIITGTGLDLVTGVSFTGGAAGEFVYADNTLTVTVPATAADGALTLSTAAEKSVVTAAVTLVKPVITGIDPLEVMAGETFTVNGTDLDLVTGVKLGSEDCVFTVAEDGTSITVTTTASSSTGRVSVSAANGYTAESSQDLTVTYDSVVIVSALTESAKPGEQVTMTGSKFNMIESVYVGDVKVTSYVSRSDSEMVFTMPEADAGTYNLRFVLTTGEEETCPLAMTVSGLSTVIELWKGSWDAGNWNGNQELAWGGYDWSAINISQGTATIVAELVQDASASWWQFMLKTGTSWFDLAGMQQVDMTAGQTSVEVPFTQEMLDDILANNGLIVTGCFYTLTRLYIRIE